MPSHLVDIQNPCILRMAGFLAVQKLARDLFLNAGHLQVHNSYGTFIVKMSSPNGTLISDDKGRRIEILRTAAELFHKRGFHATSMSDISKAVNLTKPGLYHYVESKEEMLFAIMDHAMNQLQESVIDPAKSMSDPEQCLDSIIENHALLVMGDRVITILTDEMAGLSPPHYTLLVQRKQEYFRLLRTTLDKLIETGKIRPLNPTVAAFSIFGILLWLPRWFVPDGELTRDEVIDQVKQIIYGGIIQPA